MLSVATLGTVRGWTTSDFGMIFSGFRQAESPLGEVALFKRTWMHTDLVEYYRNHPGFVGGGALVDPLRWDSNPSGRCGQCTPGRSNRIFKDRVWRDVNHTWGVQVLGAGNFLWYDLYGGSHRDSVLVRP